MHITFSVAYQATQAAKIIDLLLWQYIISILGRYSKMALGQYSFLENSVDIESWYRPNNIIVIYPISPEYCVNIDLILSGPLNDHWLNTQFLILKSQYWLDTQKCHWANIHFWNIRLILEKYIDPIIVLSFRKGQLKRSCFLLYNFFCQFWLKIGNQTFSAESSFYGIRLWSTHLFPMGKIVSCVRGARLSERDTIPTKRGLGSEVPLQ